MTNDLIEVRISTEGLFHDWVDEELHNIDRDRSAHEFAIRAEEMISSNFPYADVVVAVQSRPFDDPGHWFSVEKLVVLHPTVQRAIFGPTRNGDGPLDSLHEILRTVHDGYMWLSMGW